MTKGFIRYLGRETEIAGAEEKHLPVHRLWV